MRRKPGGMGMWPVGRAEVGGRDDGDDALLVERLGAVDRPDQRVCVRAPDDRDVEGVGKRDVVDVLAASSDEPAILDSLYRPTDQGRNRNREDE